MNKDSLLWFLPIYILFFLLGVAIGFSIMCDVSIKIIVQ